MIKVKKNNTLKKYNKINKKSLKNKIEINHSDNNQHYRKKKKMSHSDMINMLEKMQQIMFLDGQPFKARAYNKAKETIMLHEGEIKSAVDVEGKSGFRKGGSVLKTLNEFLTTGKVKKIEDSKNDMRFVFNDIYGIGPKMSKKLVREYNVKSIEELRERQDELLNDVQKKGLKYYEDVLKRIPRKEINVYNKLIQKLFDMVKSKKSKSSIQIVGSWRRNAKTSGDIDVIICDTEKNSNLFKDFIDKLIEKNILIEVLSRGNVKTLGISKLNRRSTARRIDFMFTPKEQFPFAVLYFTGSKVFNTLMRKQALNLGYTMNEHGLYHYKDGKKGKMISKVFSTEEDVFSFLGIKYVDPEMRENRHNFQLIREAENNAEEKKEKSVKNTTEKSALKKKLSVRVVKKMISVFKQKGETFLKSLNEYQVENIIMYADDQYYNKNKPMMTDEEYDVIREWAVQKFPNNDMIKKGHEGINLVACKTKVELPYFLGSMDKIKPDTKVLNNWLKKFKGPYVISAKLDGMSALYINENNESKLYTRGCGNYGFDISHLIPYVKLPDIKDSVVRGELIINKKKFVKYRKEYANERSFAAAMVNGKNLDKRKVQDLDFVGYEVIKPTLTPVNQYRFLKMKKFITVINKSQKTINQDILSEYLSKWRETYDYIIDGVICINDKIYKRKKKGNPSHAFAFKKVMTDQIVESRVIDVIWSKTQYGYVKPKIKMQTVKIGGVNIKYATAHNAKYIKDNSIGIGSVIQVVRSGDVIPKVHKVIKKAEQPKMPDASMNVKWNKSGVDLILVDKQNDETVKNKTILAFFKKIQVDGLKEGNINKIISGGFNSIEQILSMTVDDFKTIPGFKDKMANKIVNSIQNQINTVTLPRLMDASNIFGFGMGESRIKLVLTKYPDILITDESNGEKREMIMEIDGFAEKTAMKFVKNIRKFNKFLKKLNLTSKNVYKINKNINKNHVLYEKKILLTGFRDEDLLTKLRNVGVNIASSVSKQLDILIIKDDSVSSSKLDKAKNINTIEILTKMAFMKKYFP